jgi:hypothetical protein
VVAGRRLARGARLGGGDGSGGALGLRRRRQRERAHLRAAGHTSAVGGDAGVTLFFEDGSTVQAVVPVGPQRRVTIDTRVLFPICDGRRFGAVVEAIGDSPPALVVERVTYWNAEGVLWSGGTGAPASPF